MNVRYRVDLSQTEREALVALVKGAKQPVRRLKRMQILLAADAGVSDEAIAVSVQTSGSTIYRTRKRFVEISLEAALSEEPRPGAARKLSGKDEVQLVALACSDPPEGCTRWTLKLLANALLKVVEHQSVSRETIRRRLHDNDLKPWQKKMWCIVEPKAALKSAGCSQLNRLATKWLSPIQHRRSTSHNRCDETLAKLPLSRVTAFEFGKMPRRTIEERVRVRFEPRAIAAPAHVRDRSVGVGTAASRQSGQRHMRASE